MQRRDFGQYGPDSPDPFMVEQHRIVPSVARVFSPKDTLYIFFQVYVSPIKKSSPNLTASLIFLKNEDRFREAANLQLTQFDEGSNGVITSYLEVPLSAFPKSDYELQVDLSDHASQENLSRKIHFVVR